MAEHTPGPWHAPILNDGSTTGYVWAEEPHGGIVATVMPLGPNDPSDYVANARLIAAAPDMLEVLEDSDYAHCNCESPRCLRARAVIAKARGD